VPTDPASPDLRPPVAVPPRLACIAGRLRAFEAEGPLAARLGALARVVAIVGTRRPCAEAALFARGLAQALAARGVVVVSGGAIGIDAAAHEGALEAGGGTIAVFAGGLDIVYPRENAGLFAAIRAHGAIVAVHPRGTPPRDAYFHQRNAVIAALADDVVLVEAPLQSGARSTVAHARKFGRRVWVVPGAPWDPMAAGCALELANGAQALDGFGRLLRTLDDAPVEAPRASDVDPIRLVAHRSRTSTLDLVLAACASDAERAIARRIARGPVSVDEIALDGTLGVGPLRALLLTWTVEGLLKEAPPGVFFLARR
jgi:DNA processing protein